MPSGSRSRAASPVAGQDGALDRGRTPPARQQRGVDVDAAEARRFQDRPREDQPIGGDHGHVGGEIAELGLDVGRAQALRRPHRDAQALGMGVDGAGLDLVPAAGRLRRLGVAGDDRVPGRGQRVQDRDREDGRSHEDEAEHRPPQSVVRRNMILRKLLKARRTTD